MAQNSNTKIYIAVGIFAVLGGALFLQNRSHKEDVRAHTFAGKNEDLPKLDLSEEKVQKLTKVVIVQPEKKGEMPKAGSSHTLVKDGAAWRLQAPVAATANQSNVESLLKNLPKLQIKERIAKGDSYSQYDLTDETAIRVTAYEGEKPALDLWLGKSGGRGQLARIKDKPGVYVLDGYSSFLYTRDTKGWRDLAITTVETEKATRVDIQNEKGSFAFKKEGSTWKSEFKKGKSAVGAPIKDFDASKVDDLLRAYKSLNASDFGDGKTLEEVGLNEPAARIAITLEDGAKREILFGKTAEGSSRYVKLPEKEQIFAVSSWAADWATADEAKFVKKPGDAAKNAPGGSDPHQGIPGLEGMKMPPMPEE